MRTTISGEREARLYSRVYAPVSVLSPAGLAKRQQGRNRAVHEQSRPWSHRAHLHSALTGAAQSHRVRADKAAALGTRAYAVMQGHVPSAEGCSSPLAAQFAPSTFSSSATRQRAAVYSHPYTPPVLLARGAQRANLCLASSPSPHLLLPWPSYFALAATLPWPLFSAMRRLRRVGVGVASDSRRRRGVVSGVSVVGVPSESRPSESPASESRRERRGVKPGVRSAFGICASESGLRRAVERGGGRARR